MIVVKSIPQKTLDLMHALDFTSSKDKAYALNLLMNNGPIGLAREIGDYRYLSLFREVLSDLLSEFDITTEDTVTVIKTVGNEVMIKVHKNKGDDDEL